MYLVRQLYKPSICFCPVKIIMCASHFSAARITTGVIMLPLERHDLLETALTTELLCLRSLCEVESQHTNVYLQSGLDPLPPSFNQTHVLCLFAISMAFGVTTHTGGQRGEPTSVPVEEDEWGSHTSEKWKRLINSGALCPYWKGFSVRSWGWTLTSNNLENSCRCLVLLKWMHFLPITFYWKHDKLKNRLRMFKQTYCTKPVKLLLLQMLNQQIHWFCMIGLKYSLKTNVDKQWKWKYCIQKWKITD